MTAPASESVDVLVVEDDEHVRQMIVWTLEAEGFSVVAAGDGRGALRRASESRPCVVLLDIGLPDVDGYTVAAGIRAARGDYVPIVVITADGRASEKAQRVGAVDFLHKPFELDDLHELVRRLLCS